MFWNFALSRNLKATTNAICKSWGGGGEAIQDYRIRKSMFPLMVFAQYINFLGQKKWLCFFCFIPKYIQKYGEIHSNNNSKIIIIINNTLKGTQINGNCYSLLKVITSQVALVVKNLPTNAGNVRDMGLIPGSGWFPREGHGNSIFLPGESHGQRSLAGYGP